MYICIGYAMSRYVIISAVAQVCYKFRIISLLYLFFIMSFVTICAICFTYLQRGGPEIHLVWLFCFMQFFLLYCFCTITDAADVHLRDCCIAHWFTTKYGYRVEMTYICIPTSPLSHTRQPMVTVNPGRWEATVQCSTLAFLSLTTRLLIFSPSSPTLSTCSLWVHFNLCPA